MTDCIVIPDPPKGSTATFGPVDWFAPAGVINVLGWGLPNDGSDVVALWADLRTHLVTAGGGAIYFPPGEYGFSASLSLLDNIHVIADGPDVCTIKSLSGITTALVLGSSGNTVSDVTFDRIAFDGSFDTIALNIPLVQITNGNRPKFVDCTFRNSGGAGVVLQGTGAGGGTPNSTFDRCSFDGIGLSDGSTGFGILLKDSSTNAKIYHADMKNIKGGMGIGGSGSGGTGYPVRVLIDSPTIEMATSTTGFEAIGLQTNCDYWTITTPKIVNSQDNGISLSSSHNVVIGAEINGTLNHGIYSQGTDNVILGGHIRNIGKQTLTDGLDYAALRFTNSAQNRAIGVRAYDDQGVHTMAYGVKLVTPVGQNEFIGCSFDGYTIAAYSDLTSTDVVLGKTDVFSIVTQSLTVAGPVTFDPSQGRTFRVDLSANCTSCTLANGIEGQRIAILWRQDATGGRTYVWPSNVNFNNQAAPTASTVAFRTDRVEFEYIVNRWREVSRAINV